MRNMVSGLEVFIDISGMAEECVPVGSEEEVVALSARLCVLQ